jgi:hypothetical protein
VRPPAQRGDRIAAGGDGLAMAEREGLEPLRGELGVQTETEVDIWNKT